MKKLLKECGQIAISPKPKAHQLYKLYKLITNRKRFEYTSRHLFEEYFKCLCCKSRQSLKNMNNDLSKRHLYFRKGNYKLSHDLDITGMLHARFGYEILKSILFDEDD